MTRSWQLPRLEAGEKLVCVAGLVLVYDQAENLIFMRCQNGNLLSVGCGEYRLLEALGRRPGQILAYDALLKTLYDYRNEPRPESEYFSLAVGAVKKLRKKLIEATGNNSIVNHRGIGYSLMT